MKASCFALLGAGLMLSLAGCSGGSPPDRAAATEERVEKSFAELSPEDRPLASAQKFCAVEATRLGSMGKPDKVMIDGQPVFLCCQGCRKRALKDPAKTLDRVKALKEKTRRSPTE
jgi:hypothetical protein